MFVNLPSGKTVSVYVDYDEPQEDKRCTYISVLFGEDDFISGVSQCSGEDSFNRYQGKRYAVRRLFDEDTAMGRRLTKEDRRAIVKTICPKFFTENPTPTPKRNKAVEDYFLK